MSPHKPLPEWHGLPLGQAPSKLATRAPNGWRGRQVKRRSRGVRAARLFATILRSNSARVRVARILSLQYEQILLYTLKQFFPWSLGQIFAAKNRCGTSTRVTSAQNELRRAGPTIAAQLCICACRNSPGKAINVARVVAVTLSWWTRGLSIFSDRSPVADGLSIRIPKARSN